MPKNLGTEEKDFFLNNLKKKEEIKRSLIEAKDYLIQLENLQNSFDYIKLSISSPEKIRNWSTREIIFQTDKNLITKVQVGEVLNHETVKFTDYSPIKGGLFCEVIFGPLKTGFCSCGKSSTFLNIGLVCPSCLVEFTDSRVRRYRMGTFNLKYPASHIWFLKGRPSYFEQLLGLKKNILERVLYYKELFSEDQFKFEKKNLLEQQSLYPFYTYTKNDRKYFSLVYKFFLSIATIEKSKKLTLLNSLNTCKNLKNLLQNQKLKITSFLNNNELIKENKKFFQLKIVLKLKKLLEKIEIYLTKLNNYQGILYYLSTEKKIAIDNLKLDENFQINIENFYKFLPKKQIGFLAKFTQLSEKLFYNEFLSEILSKPSNVFINKQKFFENLAYSILSNSKKDKNSGKVKKRLNGEVVYSMLDDLDLFSEIKALQKTLLFTQVKSNKNIIKRLRILESFLSTQTSPTSIMLCSLPILPPTLRPLQELNNGKIISADINEVYKLIILRTKRLSYHETYSIGDDHIVKCQAAKGVQESIDALIDNARMPKNKVMTLNNRPLKTLTEILEGKEGRFRQTLLGKRVDYSGRSVIVVGPELSLEQCGLPYEIARTLFEPFLINKLLELKYTQLTKNQDYPDSNEIYKINVAYKKFLQLLITKNKPIIIKLLYNLIKKYSILLNRAPTLHKFGIQAFKPFLVFDKAIHLHPLVCTGFNADFDGDQMAVHLPLRSLAQLEAKNLLKSSNNILSSANGQIILKPSQDIVIGSYYLTLKKKLSFHKKIYWFSNINEVIKAVFLKKIDLQNPVYIYNKFNKIQIFEKNGTLILSNQNFPLWAKEIKIFKLIWPNYLQKNSIYIITNIGIIKGIKLADSKYLLSECILETTPGRILFALNLK